MITEDYVSFEVAKLLKEKGFDEIKCNTCYKWNGNFCNNRRSMSGVDNEICYQAPTLQMARKWLMEKHNLYIDPYPEDNHTWCLIIWEVYPECVKQCKGKYDDYSYLTCEEACEAAIKYCLENLI